MVSVVTAHSQGLGASQLITLNGKTLSINITPQYGWIDHKHRHELTEIFPGSKNDH